MNMCRAATSWLWAILTMMICGRIWKHYYEAYVHLEWSTKRQLALLNSMFDFVVPIENGSDFRILEENRKLEGLVGRPMKSQSIFSCCGSDEARSQLRKLLTSTTCALLTDEVADEKRMSRMGNLSAWLHQHWWWSLVPP